MPLSHCRRPLVLAAVSYALLLALLKAWGAFEPREDARFRTRWTDFTGRAASACVETRLGDRLTVLARVQEAAERVEVYLPRGRCDELRPLPGQLLELRGRLRRARPWLGPGDFDEAEALAARGIRWILRASGARTADVSVPWAWKPQAWAEALRVSAHDAFRAALAPDDARLMEGLVFGTKGALAPALQRSVQDAGVMHLIVPSGAKVGAIVWGLAWLLRRARLRPAAALPVAVAAGGIYCLAAGGEAPYLRAYAAALAGLAAAFWPGRDAGGLQAIAVSSLAILLVWPRALFSIGFQMTYAAALALWLSAARWRPRFGPRWLRPGLQALAMSFAAQLALWPLFSDVFGRASAAGVLANAVLVPAYPLFMAAGLGLWALPCAASAKAAAWSVAAFKAACAFFAGLPYAAMELCPMSAAAAAAWDLGCSALLVLPELKSAATLAVLALGVLAFDGAAAWAQGPRLAVCVLGDGRGWSALAELPSGERWAIEPGLPPSRLAAAWRELGARPVDRLAVLGESREGRRGLDAAERWPVSRVSGAPRPFELGFGRVVLRFSERPGVLTIRRGPAGPVEFCILLRANVETPAWCAPAGIRGLGPEGALWIITDGERYQVASTRAARPLRRPLL